MPFSLTRRAALHEVSLVARQRAYPDCSRQPMLALAGSRRSKASLSGEADRKPNLSTQATSEPESPRHPRSVQALHLKPLKREAEHGIPSCDLQLRSYSLQPLDFFCDFALRAAYYLGLPAYGPVPLPRITQRWTVPRSHFIFKKSQENFERITLRRLIQIKDGNPETVQLWLAYLRKHQYYGIGMKANMWEFSELGGQSVTKQNTRQYETDINAAWPHLGQVKPLESALEADKVLNHRLSSEASGPR
ncbi:putative tryptophanyl-tRNA synthetase [Emericellopsis atlantica]|uniref:Small ribosomal subunit protein uS10m n=1 Tax=Emericellopsis atlantica TaxID=2614577 RepID=A0A9P7ZIR2_9HYPO|nr:putative tryptophanyl-tRNA synthetase [Emericellopsis atlantica]KAG9252745.1 putative tryptophanyl-tRNA synthetase [Emericellopsis atlantica]